MTSNVIGDSKTEALEALSNRPAVYKNLERAALIEHAVRRGEGELTAWGPFNAVTTPHTGRSPKDKFIVTDEETAGRVWWGEVNREMSEAHFDLLFDDVVAYLREQEAFQTDVFAGADPAVTVPVRFISTGAWQSLFVRNMFVRPDAARLEEFQPEFTVLHAPNMQADPARHGTRSGTFIVLNLSKKIVLIGGTNYAGEMKKSIFSVLNYVYPLKGILSMHCSANVGDDGDVAVFFGLSGTGKTTLSADPARGLIGDDEHGWSDSGVFNFEGGCYAKVIRLSADGEPEIYSTTRRFGTILENVVVDPRTREIDLDDDSITENTRASYPIDFIPNHVPEGRAGQPRNIIFLTCDAFGVLPPVSRLTADQAMYHFLSGYTAKVAGTERGITEPQATFSACFGAPFLPLHPGTYARMLGERIDKHGVDCWLVNTGWTGGGYGTGCRMKLGYTRKMITAILDGSLKKAPGEPDPIFGLTIPAAVPGVPAEILNPRNTWDDTDAYDREAKKLARMFRDNFEDYADQVTDAIRQAAPRG